MIKLKVKWSDWDEPFRDAWVAEGQVLMVVDRVRDGLTKVILADGTAVYTNTPASELVSMLTPVLGDRSR